MTQIRGAAQGRDHGRSVSEDSLGREALPEVADSPAQPQRPASKNIIVCLDGTNDELGESRPTNPAKVFEMLDLDNPLRQMAYYDPGVGTLPASTARGKAGRLASRLGQLAFGLGMKTNLMQSYTWLMQNYRPGDKLYVFGFSRGAYTARALVGMLARPGLLRSGSLNLVEYAVKEYAKKRPVNDQEAFLARVGEFADALCWGTRSHPMNKDWPYCPDPRDEVHSIPVEYLGIWDTVEASGLAGIGEVKWPDTTTLWNVRRLRHAVSIDERRRPFHEFLVEPRAGFEEVWFAGVHSDVGGTFLDCELATIALKWVFDGICQELHLRDRKHAAAYAKWCTVDAEFATAAAHDNGWTWKLLPGRTRPIPGTALLHETVKLRRARQPFYLRTLGNADQPSRWADPGWLTPASFDS